MQNPNVGKEVAESARAAPWSRIRLWRRERGRKGAIRLPIVPLIVLVCVLIIPGLFAPWLAPYNPVVASLTERFYPPAWLPGGSPDHILGTDSMGRDVLSRVIYGSRTSLLVATLCVILSQLIGATLGMVAGLKGGRVDMFISRLIDIMFAIPAILIALVLAVILGQGLGNIILIVATILWARAARQIRGSAISIRNHDFVTLARIAGSSDFRTLIRHIFPNVLNTIVVVATLELSFVILFEATLSFLGIGLPPPTPAWGLMVAEGRAYIVSAWWLCVFPGVAIVLTVLSFNLLGDWLRDRLDPKLRQI